jgi:hydrogenase maturation protease
MSHPRILVACIGNIFSGDDGFGTEVARRMSSRPLPREVTLKDFGIRGLDLIYALLDPYEYAILVDACPRGGKPGSVYLLEPELETESAGAPQLEAHAMDPMQVLRTVQSMGGPQGKILIVGCEPADLGGEDGKLGLSEAVEGAVDEAIALIEDLVSKLLAGERGVTAGDALAAQ